MYNWFYNPEIQFDMWGTSHAVIVIVILCLFSTLFLFQNTFIVYRRMIRIIVGSLLILSRISLDIWYVLTGTWDIQSSLPLELCSITSLICGVMLLTKSYRLFEVFYFIAIGGALQAIITPELHFGFPQYRFLQFFIDHFLLILAPFLMIVLYNFTVTIKSVWKAFLTINIIALIVFVLNTILSANYMFLRHKPTSASLLDLLGPYPLYLLALEGITLIVFFLLYIPFAWNDRKTKENGHIK